MKKYKDYMDGVTASDTLHEKLKHLEPAKKKPVWQKYGAAAAALVLMAGLGVWGLTGGRDAVLNHTEQGDPEIGTIEPAIEPASDPMPNSPGMQTMGGYEVSHGEMVAYYMLPYIEYGEVENEMQADIALPVGVTRRDLTDDELLALLGGETNLTTHLNWSGYEIGAYAMVWPDDSLWLLCIYGSKGDTGLEHFALEVMPGELPPSCCYYEKGQLNNIWERDVWAESYDSEIGSSRRVTFMDEGYGYRFAITGTDKGAITELVSRMVRFIIVGDGLLLNQNQDVPAHVPGEVCTAPSATPSYSVGEPNFEDAPHTEPGEPVEEANTSAYDPSASPTPTADAESAETKTPAPPEP